VLVLPIQNNPVFPKSVDAAAKMTQVRAFRSALDDSIAAALNRRGIGAPWTFAASIIASSRRNGGLVADPSDLAVGKLRSFTHAGDDPISEPLASQLRGLVALREGRYALLPATIYFDDERGGTRVTLLLYLIDTRTARITWSGFARSDVGTAFSPALAQSTAEHVADLVVPR
jgi:hypothetical protein